MHAIAQCPLKNLESVPSGSSGSFSDFLGYVCKAISQDFPRFHKHLPGALPAVPVPAAPAALAAPVTAVAELAPGRASSEPTFGRSAFGDMM